MARITVNTRRLDNLRAALHRGEVDMPVLEALGERCRENVIENWSGLFPPASRPGKPPAIRTGALSRSVRVESGNRIVLVKAGGGSGGVEYALYLEYGTRHMAPRPFMLPAAEQTTQEARNIVREVGGRVIRIAMR